jgi:hypothetical protein
MAVAFRVATVALWALGFAGCEDEPTPVVDDNPRCFKTNDGYAFVFQVDGEARVVDRVEDVPRALRPRARCVQVASGHRAPIPALPACWRTDEGYRFSYTRGGREVVVDRIAQVPRRHRAAARCRREGGAQDAGAPEPARGELELDVRPWGKVWLDGRLLGTTPLKPLSLAPGRHRLRIAREEKTYESVVDIAPREQTLLVIDMKRGREFTPPVR